MSKTENSEKKKELIRSIKFTLFSLSAGAIQLGSFTLLTLFTDMPYWPRYLISLALSVIYNFSINRRFTFKSAANIPIAMLKVFGYYCVFTPLTTVVGNYLVDVLYWNDFLVEILSMFLNFVTEFLFTRFIVYGKNVDNSKSYLEKHEAAAKTEGPAVSRKAIVICIVCVLISAAIISAVLVFGYRPSDRIEGEWKSYVNDKEITYTFSGGHAVFADDSGTATEYDYTISGSDIVFKNSNKEKHYKWTADAVIFLSSHQYGEVQKLLSIERAEDKNFSGYMYVDGDFLYIGMICMCRAERMTGYTDDSIEGDWIGAAGDKVSFNSDGSYYYKDYGQEYNGTYSVDKDESKLILTLGDDSTVYHDAQWGINGRVLNIEKQYYFRDSEEKQK